MTRFASIIAAVALLALNSIAHGQSALPRRPILGLPVAAMTADQQKELGLGAQEGVSLNTVPASLQGKAQAGDVLVSIKGQSFKSFAEMNNIVRKSAAGETVKLKFRRGKETFEVDYKLEERPRETSPDYDVIYDHVQVGKHRARLILTKPKAPGKYPVFMWIQGISLGTVDFPISGASNTAKVMQPFAKGNFVTVRVEKLGIGDSEGDDPMAVDFDTETDTFRQGLKALSKYEFADTNKVFLFGHSMGGCHAPILASETPVAGIITYGTVSDSWLEWQIKAVRIQGPLGGEAPAETDRQARLVTALYHYIYNEKKSIAWIKENKPELRAIADEHAPDGKNMSVRSIEYMVQCNDKNYNDYWTKVGNAKVLALFGEADFIALESCQVQLATVVNKTQPGNAEYRKLPGVDHGFTKTRDLADSFAKWGKPGNEFNDIVATAALEWVQSKLK